MSIANEDWQDMEKAFQKVVVSKSYGTIDVQTLSVFLTINYSAAVLNVLVQLQTTFFSLQDLLRRQPAQPCILEQTTCACCRYKVQDNYLTQCRDGGGQHRARRFRHAVMYQRNPFFLVGSPLRSPYLNGSGNCCV